METVVLLPLSEIHALIQNKCASLPLESQQRMTTIVHEVFRELYLDGFAVCETEAVKRLRARGKFSAEQLQIFGKFLIRRVVHARKAKENEA
jgi:hypothetical protein